MYENQQLWNSLPSNLKVPVPVPGFFLDNSDISLFTGLVEDIIDNPKQIKLTNFLACFYFSLGRLKVLVFRSVDHEWKF